MHSAPGVLPHLDARRIGPGSSRARAPESPLHIFRLEASFRSRNRMSASDHHPVKSHRRPVPSGGGSGSEEPRPIAWRFRNRLERSSDFASRGTFHLPITFREPWSVRQAGFSSAASGPIRPVNDCAPLTATAVRQVCQRPKSSNARGVFSVTAAGIAAVSVG